METTYFVLGMLSMIAVTFITTVIMGLLKINKQQKTIDELIERVKGLHLDHSQQFDNVYRNIDQTSNEMHRVMRDRENDLSNRFSDIERRLDHTESEMYRQINDQVTDAVLQSKSYTDSRIDKTTTKQVIKG